MRACLRAGEMTGKEIYRRGVERERECSRLEFDVNTRGPPSRSGVRQPLVRFMTYSYNPLLFFAFSDRSLGEKALGRGRRRLQGRGGCERRWDTSLGRPPDVAGFHLEHVRYCELSRVRACVRLFVVVRSRVQRHFSRSQTGRDGEVRICAYVKPDLALADEIIETGVG